MTNNETLWIGGLKSDVFLKSHTGLNALRILYRFILLQTKDFESFRVSTYFSRDIPQFKMCYGVSSHWPRANLMKKWTLVVARFVDDGKYFTVHSRASIHFILKDFILYSVVG